MSLNDNSNGYTVTFRKVYKEMSVDWKNRCTRYKNKTGNKKQPSNILLIEEDNKLLKLFTSTVNKMLEESKLKVN